MNRSLPKGSKSKVALRWAKRLVLLAFLAGLVALLVIASLPKPVPVEMAAVTEGALVVTIDEDGKSRVKDRYLMSAPLNGSLARVDVNPGDEVEEGQVLARIVPLESPLLDARSRSQAEARVAAALAAQRQAKAQVERAQAAAEFAKNQAERMARLAGSSAVPPVEIEQAQMQARTAAADLESARFGATVADYEVRMAQAALGHLSGKGASEDQLDLPAPVAGRVLKVIRESEGVIQVGSPILELGDPKTLEIAIDVLTSDAVRVTPGNRVVIDRWGGPALEGRVRLIEPSAFTRVSALGVEEQRVNVIVDLTTDAAQWAALGDGYRVEAYIVVWEGQGVIKVPASSLFRHDGGWAVYRVEEEIARLTRVEIGERTPAEVQVLQGLGTSDRVIVSPSDRVADGVRVVARR